MSEQLVKKEGQGYNRVYPKTFIDAVIDRESGQSLVDILSSFNCYFLSYADNAEDTRIQVPQALRKQGLWITYVSYTGIITTEYYSSNELDDNNWKDSKNWLQGSNTLVGDIAISSEGHWIVKGEDTGIIASGKEGISPILRIDNNRLQVSYNEGTSFTTLNDTPIYTKFRVDNNKLQISTDLEESWTDVSDPIAAWFRWVEGDFNTVGKIQISRDKENWTDLSPSISNTLKVQAYYKTLNDAPDTADEGYIIMVGPFYDESELPKYELYIYLDNGWFDVGSFQSIQSGVTGEIDEGSLDNGLTVPTVEAVVNYVKPIKQNIDTINSQLNGLTIEKPLSELEYEEQVANGEVKEDSLYFVYEDDETEET